MATSAQLRKQILQGSWDDALAALYGADPAVLQRQHGRYAAALEQFELYFGPGRQVQVYSAPGRDRKSTRLNSSHNNQSRMPSSA